MKCHYFLEGTHSGTYDLDKKIPSLKKLFPTSKLEKKGIGFNDREFIIIKDIADVKLISYDETPCDIDLTLDYYMTEVLGYTFLDIQFEITEEMAEEINAIKEEVEEAAKEVSKQGVKDEFSGTEPPKEL